MRSAHQKMTVALALSVVCSAWATEGTGLLVSAPVAPRWQGRLSLGMSAVLPQTDLSRFDGADLKVTGASLLSDYYFRSAPDSSAHGFRATSGLVWGPRAGALLPAAATLPGRGFTVERRSLNAFALTSGSDAAADTAAAAYLGLGYSAWPHRGGWGFSADVGVMALNPGSAVKLGGTFVSPQRLDDTLHDMRLSPLLQLGASYSF